MLNASAYRGHNSKDMSLIPIDDLNQCVVFVYFIITYSCYDDDILDNAVIHMDSLNAYMVTQCIWFQWNSANYPQKPFQVLLILMKGKEANCIIKVTLHVPICVDHHNKPRRNTTTHKTVLAE